MSGRGLVAVGRQQLPQQNDFGRLGIVALEDQELHLTGEKQKAPFAFGDAADKAPALAGFDVDGGLEQHGVNRPAKQPRFEHLDAILFHDLTMTSQQRRGKP